MPNTNNNTANIEVELHSSVIDNPLFEGIESLNVNKEILFANGALKGEVPEHLKESEFEYLKNQVPHLMALYEDWIDFEEDRIVNKSTNREHKKDVSEIIGIGVGLHFTQEVFGVQKNRFSKIPEPNSRIKYLDYTYVHGEGRHEVETKGTTVPGNVNGMIQDCLEKKEAQTTPAFRYGLVTVIGSPTNDFKSKIIVCDDPPEDIQTTDTNLKNVLLYYAKVLSFIADNRYYNRFIRQVLNGEIRTRNILPLGKFRYKYSHNGKFYYGTFFDRRLILKEIKKYAGRNVKIQTLFSALTKEVGQHKYFMGLDEEILKNINSHDFESLLAYSCENQVEYQGESHKVQTSEGLIIVKSAGEQDDQITQNYTEEDVKNEIKNMDWWMRGIPPPECGSPCRSWHIRGKPCEIKTYRGTCRFHR